MRIGPLYEKVVIDKCVFKIKKNMVTFKLPKQKKQWWGDIKPKGNQFEQLDEEGKVDHEKSLMEMVKHVYKTGDTKIK